ncbi:MAG: hypothetical protein GY842_14085 [bacterium]|nr:hypothetical protein [bacterium]
MSTTLTKTVEKRITADWQSEIVGMGVHKPRHLLRRVGPVLVGICLDRGSDGMEYLPTFHTHFLGNVFPVVSLTLSTPLRTERNGAEDWIPIRGHADRFPEAAAMMTKVSLLPLDGDLRLAAVLDAYRRYMATPMGRRQTATLYRDMVLLRAWARDANGAHTVLDEGLAGLGNNEAALRHVGGRKAFIAKSREAITQPELIDQTIESQIEALRLGDLPISELVR